MMRGLRTHTQGRTHLSYTRPYGEQTFPQMDHVDYLVVLLIGLLCAVAVSRAGGLVDSWVVRTDYVML